MVSTTMKHGIVKFYNQEKSFGFITPTEGGNDVFVHRSALTDGVMLYEGDKVTFEVEMTPKGASAINVNKED